MRDSWLRAVLGALAIGATVAGAAIAVAACGQGGSSGGGSGQDSSAAEAQAEGEAPESGGGDSTTLPDSPTDSAALDSTAEGSGLDGGADADGPYFDFDAGDCGALGPVGEPVELSCTGLYSDWASKTVSPDVTQYDPGLHFWSDGASKTRWIHLPPGQKIDTSDMDEWTFPVGTKIWKEFRLALGDASTETRIETRLIWKLTPTFWYLTTYKWSADGTTSATELTAGQLDAGNGTYEIPAQFKCATCHNGRQDEVLGFEAVSLSTPAASGITMQTLVAQGLVTDAPEAGLVVPGDATQAAALGWLHSNCGTACHNVGGGLAKFTGFIMRLDVGTLGSVDGTYAYSTGWNQQTSGYSIPGASNTFRLHACDLTESAAYFRAGHRDGVAGAQPGTQMPPLDSHAVDTVDVAGLAAWIDEGCDAGAGDQ